MKKLILAFALFALAFASNGCSGSGDELTDRNLIRLQVDGLAKTFNVTSVNTNNPETIVLFGQINGSFIETIEITVYKNATGTGTSAIPNIAFTQDNVIYYSEIGTGVSTNVETNGDDRKLKGTFQGTFKTLSNASKIISNGTFNVSY